MNAKRDLTLLTNVIDWNRAPTTEYVWYLLWTYQVWILVVYIIIRYITRILSLEGCKQKKKTFFSIRFVNSKYTLSTPLSSLPYTNILNSQTTHKNYFIFSSCWVKWTSKLGPLFNDYPQLVSVIFQRNYNDISPICTCIIHIYIYTYLH